MGFKKGNKFYLKRMHGKYTQCNYCGDAFYTGNKSVAKFCSVKCKNKYRCKNDIINKTANLCVVCKKYYVVSVNRLVKHNDGRKCSISCGLKNNKFVLGRKLSELERIKRSEQQKGQNCHFWKGGKTKESQLIRNSYKYKDWRKSVFERDKYTCVLCGSRSCKGKKVILNADHIKPFAYFPELRFDLENGRTLCIICHRKTDTYAKRYKKDDT